jgi:hypothetical protein
MNSHAVPQAQVSVIKVLVNVLNVQAIEFSRFGKPRAAI